MNQCKLHYVMLCCICGVTISQCVCSDTRKKMVLRDKCAKHQGAQSGITKNVLWTSNSTPTPKIMEGEDA